MRKRENFGFSFYVFYSGFLSNANVLIFCTHAPNILYLLLLCTVLSCSCPTVFSSFFSFSFSSLSISLKFFFLFKCYALPFSLSSIFNQFLLLPFYPTPTLAHSHTHSAIPSLISSSLFLSKP
jgi:hypothetical protein